LSLICRFCKSGMRAIELLSAMNAAISLRE
jgi:hypothetical protein